MLACQLLTYVLFAVTLQFWTLKVPEKTSKKCEQGGKQRILKLSQDLLAQHALNLVRLLALTCKHVQPQAGNSRVIHHRTTRFLFRPLTRRLEKN